MELTYRTLCTKPVEAVPCPEVVSVEPAFDACSRRNDNANVVKLIARIADKMIGRRRCL